MKENNKSGYPVNFISTNSSIDTFQLCLLPFFKKKKDLVDDLKVRVADREIHIYTYTYRKKKSSSISWFTAPMSPIGLDQAKPYGHSPFHNPFFHMGDTGPNT